MSIAKEKTIRVLLVEPYRPETVGIRALLARVTGFQLVLEEADSLSTALRRLAKGGIHIVLLNLRLPEAERLEGLGTLRSRFPDIPVVVLTDLNNKQLAPTVMQMGARDCIVTDYIDSHLLGRIILRHVGEP